VLIILLKFADKLINFDFSSYGDGDDDDGAASVAASKSSKLPVLEKLGDEEGNINVASVTNAVKGKVGNLIGKGIGGIGGMGALGKLGGGSWF
jgi:hypothetical protein